MQVSLCNRIESTTFKNHSKSHSQLIVTEILFSDKVLKYIYSFDSRNPNITTLAKRTDSVRLLNSELNWFRPSKSLSKVKDTPIVDASVLICDKKSKKSLFTFKTLDGEIIKIGSEKIEQKNYENCERLIFNFIYYVIY